MTVTDKQLIFQRKPLLSGRGTTVFHIPLKTISNVSADGGWLVVNGKEPRTRPAVEIAFNGENPQSLTSLAEKIRSLVASHE